MFCWKHYWLPNSPDLNPMDFSEQGVIEREVNKKFHEKIDSLRAAIIRKLANMNSVHVKRTCALFRSHLEAVIKGEVSWIE